MGIDSFLPIVAFGQIALLMVILGARFRGANNRPNEAILYLLGVLAGFLGLFSIVLLKDHGAPAFLHRFDVFFGLMIAPMIALHASAISSDWSGVAWIRRRNFLFAFGAAAIFAAAFIPRNIAITAMIILISCAVLWSLHRLLMRQGQNTNPKTQSQTQELDWLRNAHIAFSVIIGLGLCQHALERLTLPGPGSWLTRLVFLSVLALVGFISIKTASTAQTPAPQRKKLRKNLLADTENERLQARLTEAMSKRALYRNPQLQLDGLANDFGVPGDSVSEAIRRGLGANFFDFVNRFRIEEAKTLLTSTSHPVEQIMFSVGFNSKSSFYSEFKKRTGHSPATFRRINASE